MSKIVDKDLPCPFIVQQSFDLTENQRAIEVFSRKFAERAYQLTSELRRDAHAQIAGYTLGEIADDFSRMLFFHELSPIEEIFAAVLAFAEDSHGRIRYQLNGLAVEKGTVVECQKSVGPFRADFMLTCHFLGKRKRFAIECDGHAFHEKTPEQAQKDKRRDRYFLAEGITVLRFTGSEIYCDPYRCCAEVERFLRSANEELREQWALEADAA